MYIYVLRIYLTPRTPRAFILLSNVFCILLASPSCSFFFFFFLYTRLSVSTALIYAQNLQDNEYVDYLFIVRSCEPPRCLFGPRLAPSYLSICVVCGWTRAA